MFIEERHQAILDILKEKERISTGEIQRKFAVSFDSARRDLRILEEKQLLKRTHGGAIPIQKAGTAPPKERDLRTMEVDEHYDVIAEKAASTIEANDIIYITSGSVGYLMLKYLPRDIEYTIVVNSPVLADELKYRDNVAVYITGGKMRMRGSASIVDSFAINFIKGMHFDKAYLTGGGADAEFGFSNGSSETAAFQLAVIENSRINYLLLPNQKVGFKSFIKVCDIDKFDTLITDWEVVEDVIDSIKDKGVNVICVNNRE